MIEMSSIKPMRVLLLDTGNEWGGGTNSMFELLKRINRNQFDITALFYTNYRKGEASDLQTELAAINIPLKILPIKKQPLWAKFLKEVARGILCFSPTLRKKAIHHIEMAWRIQPRAEQIAQVIRENNFGLLYLNNQPSSNLEGYLAAAMTATPTVQHCRIAATLAPQEARIVNRVASKIICVSKGVMNSLTKHGVRPDLCCVVYNAIDGKQVLPEPVILPPAGQHKLVIGSVGSLIKRKANSHLLQAVARLKKNCAIPLHIVLVGEGPDREALTDIVNKLGLQEDVTFAGFQNTPISWMAAMDIVVLASANEGLPRVILEAMLLAKPVVASDIVGSNELVANNQSGFLYPYGDIEKLTTSLKKLIEEDTLRNQFGKIGRRIVLEKFTIENYVANVESVMGEIIQ